MMKSETISELAKALVKFNGEVSRIAKDAANPFYKNTYATLDNIIDEVRPILNKHGLSIMQFPSGDGEHVTLKTLLLHESGEWIESDAVSMKPVKNDPQAVGSAISYARRYSLNAFLNLNTGEDDDGHKATQPEKGSSDTGPSNLSTLKAKWQTLSPNNSLDGFDDWVKGQQAKGYGERQMESYLTKKLNEKKGA